MTHTHLDIEHGWKFIHQVHHMTLFALVFNVGAPKVQFPQTIVQVFPLFLYTNNRVNEYRVDGCLCVYSPFSRFVYELLSVFAGKETACQPSNVIGPSMVDPLA